MRIACLGVMLLTSYGSAVEYSRFPGLSELTKRADSIAIVVIQDSVARSITGDGAIQKVEILCLLKGNQKEGDKLRVLIQPARFEDKDGRARGNLLPVWLREGERYVLFMRKADSKLGETMFDYRTMSTSGDVIWVAPSTVLSKLKAGNVRESIKMILSDAISDQRNELKGMEDAAGVYMETP